AAISHLPIADAARHLRQQRADLAKLGGVFDHRVRYQRPDRDQILVHLDAAQRRNPPEVDQAIRAGQPQLENGEQAVAAGERLGAGAARLKSGERLFQCLRRGVVKGARNHGLPSFCISRQIFSGLSGMSTWRTPNGSSASITALTMAGVAPIVPASPTPFTPNGFTGLGVSVRSVSKRGHW